MNFSAFLAIFACKILIKTLRLIGHGGTAIPGKVALMLCPGLLGYIAKDVHSVVITGTNGKTTSARMVEEIFAESGESYFANRSGANLINGITAEFVEHCTLSGKCKAKYAIIESDEAASKEVCRFLNPDAVLVTNVFRDQLDRFGDVNTTLENILIGIKNSPNATICLNCDCPLTASIEGMVDNQVILYGVEVPIYKNPVDDSNETMHCPYCKVEYDYSYRTFGHLGGWKCPKCGRERPHPLVAVIRVDDCGMDSSLVRMRILSAYYDAKINVPGGYNIYNAVGAMATAQAMLMDTDTAIAAIGSFSCGFGRMEQFKMDNSFARMILIKNATGCNQVLNYLTGLHEKTLFVCCINDNTGDGTDVSWIWDAGFERLAEMEDILGDIYVAGIRRDDMALRLKYAGIAEEHIQVFGNYDELIKAMRSQNLPTVIMPTYSAMMDLRAKMSAAFGGKDFWE